MRLAKKRIDLKSFVRAFAKTLVLPKERSPKPILIAPAGPSCVGKTTVMKFIQGQLPYFVRIENDGMRLFLRRSGFEAGNIERLIHEALPAYHLAGIFLKRGYSVIVDANIASSSAKFGRIREIERKLGTKIYLIRVTATRAFIKNKLKHKKFLKSGLLPNREVAWEHFERSRKQFDYGKFKNSYLVRVNAGRPLGVQLKKAIAVLQDAIRA